ncbi:hypothetical protein LEP1GSC059_2576 [Leptospira noguchii serovar Panama str. CZ214]|uniref:Uncharacterized protein n=1 Tax=Leptospira noguchii serovar Panama str. CZ214 TaxID=1001595 RepID=T0GR63_9LEPT|nr:hypothetical protein LEP1GSC059_2576 [Leptospira noguchii serovar Panama str. CZ214]
MAPDTIFDCKKNKTQQLKNEIINFYGFVGTLTYSRLNSRIQQLWELSRFQD